MRNDQLVRVLRLAARLKDARVRPDLHDLARDFAVTTRTIRRDLHALRDAGYITLKGYEAGA